MVEAIHRIGHVIGERATAECVESLLVRAKALGVDYVQGFAAATPRPFDAAGTHDATEGSLKAALP
jgi:EAL domain-containing protein (putative c-di-GMP-specific phosphodiesterase class I)